MMKQGREVRTSSSELFRTSYGTVDVGTLKSIYLNLSSWVEPTIESESWNRTIDRVKFKINNLVHRELLKTEQKESDIKHKGIYQPIKEMTDKIINDTLLTTKTFQFHKTKK